MDTVVCSITENANEELVRLFSEQFASTFHPIIIADGNTWQVAGSQLQDLFVAKGIIVEAPYLFPADPMPYADEYSIAAVHEVLEGTDYFPIAVGSGTINDIVKRASFECDRRYMVLATAPSVDGYTSYGAAVSIGGFKQTLPCTAPYGVFATPSVLRNAPMPMIGAGYGDLAAKIPAGADWIIADALGLQPIQADIWDMIQPQLRSEIGCPEAVAQRDAKAIAALFDGLCQTGFAMQVMEDSRPASGAEHLISHIWEMDHLCFNDVPVSHGYKVALGTLISTAFMEELCRHDAKSLQESMALAPNVDLVQREAQVRSCAGDSPAQESILQIVRQKFLQGTALHERRMLIIKEWPSMRENILEQLIPFATLRDMFTIVGCPTTPSQIGVGLEQLRRGITMAQMIRTRYTILDLAYDCGLFDTIMHTVCDTETYFKQG